MIDIYSFINRLEQDASQRATECKLRYVFSIHEKDFDKVKQLLRLLKDDFKSSELWLNRECIKLTDLEKSLNHLDDSDSADFYFNLRLEWGNDEIGCKNLNFSNAYSLSYFKDKSHVDISLSLFVDLFSEILFFMEEKWFNNESAAEKNRKIFNQLFNKTLICLEPYRIEFEAYSEMDYVWVIGMRNQSQSFP